MVNIKTDKIILEYLNVLKENNPYNIFLNVLKENGLYLFYYKYNEKENEKEYKLKYVYNKIRENYRRKTLIDIINKFKKNGIEYISFKGSILTDLLYDDLYLRSVGDIDLYVDNKHYENALIQLLNMGYELIEEKNQYNYDHHLFLYKKDIAIELHKNFLRPNMNVVENFKNDLMNYNLLGFDIITLNYTSTLIYLFYHHYMHMCDSGWYKDISIISNYTIYKQEPQLKRFYEIALFIEKYSENINWDMFYNEIMYQDITYEFKIIINEFNDIFNRYIPHSLFDYLNDKKYAITEKLSMYFLLKNTPLKNTETIMNVVNEKYSNNMILNCYQHNLKNDRYYIDEYSENKINVNNTYVIYGIPPESSNDLSYYVNFSIDDEFLFIDFDITDDIFIPIKKNDLMTKKDRAELLCDNCNIIITTGTGEYRYHNIFIFPMEIENDCCIKVQAFDKKNIITDVTQYVNPKIIIKQNGYKISCNISLEYLKIKNENDNHFYMDLNVNDCDDKSYGRKNNISFSAKMDYWYDPRMHSKIIIKK